MKISGEMWGEKYWSDAFEYACEFLSEKYCIEEDEDGFDLMDNISYAKLWEIEYNCKVELKRNTGIIIPGTNIELPQTSYYDEAYIFGDIIFNTEKDFESFKERFGGKPYIYDYMKDLEDPKYGVDE